MPRQVVICNGKVTSDVFVQPGRGILHANSRGESDRPKARTWSHKIDNYKPTTANGTYADECN